MKNTLTFWILFYFVNWFLGSFCHLIFFVTRKFLDRFQCFSLSYSFSVFLSHTFHPINFANFVVSDKVYWLTSFTGYTCTNQNDFSNLLIRFCKVMKSLRSWYTIGLCWTRANLALIPAVYNRTETRREII